eukprot:TRINITY_DN2788_c0_g1_i1.p1 TRINITY_DN2788_c0_g1~~TRINITY_DN2788_c0_g1_i1.p1  ORF type:complete len:281 (-),score=65.04 TRINITY_DN2788_c0_g1_i1:24-866(-)
MKGLIDITGILLTRGNRLSYNLFKLSCKLNPTTTLSTTTRHFARYSSTLTTTNEQTLTPNHASNYKLPFEISPEIELAPVMNDPNLEYPPAYTRPPPQKQFKLLDFLQEVADNRVEDAERSLQTQEDIVNKYGPFYHLPLLTAVQYGSYEATKLLLQYKADVNIQQVVTGNTALHFVITAIPNKRVKQLNIATSLIENGANPNLINTSGITPLHLACLRGNFELVKLFVEKSTVPVDFSIKDPLGRDASKVAVDKERLDIAEYLDKKKTEQSQRRLGASK